MTTATALQTGDDPRLDTPRSGTPTGGGTWGGPVARPQLRLVPDRPSTATFRRRRLLVLVGVVLVGLLLVAMFGQVGASAELSNRVDGHVVVEPGQTLWEVAAATAPADVDVRQHLAAIEKLNGVRAADVRAWNVVLLPAR